MFSKTATISGDKENFYNTIAQALTADNKPDPNGCGRVKLLDWIRKRRPDLLPVARLIMGTPSFIPPCQGRGRLAAAFRRRRRPGLLRRRLGPTQPRVPRLQRPQLPKSACGGSSRDVRCPPSSASASSTTSATKFWGGSV